MARSDGAKSFVHVEVPGEVRIEDEDAGTRGLHVRVWGFDDEEFSLVRIETVYNVSFYHVNDPTRYVRILTIAIRFRTRVLRKK